MKKIREHNEIVNEINSNKIGIIPTDTVLGIVCKLNNVEGIERIYRVKKRDSNKKFPILFSNPKQIENKADISPKLKEFWESRDEPTTILLVRKDRPLEKIALRWVRDPWLRKIIEKTGPIVATSCNESGKATINDPNLLGEMTKKVDFYLLKNPKRSAPSAILDWQTQIWIR